MGRRKLWVVCSGAICTLASLVVSPICAGPSYYLVSSFNTDQILKYDINGSPLGVFADGAVLGGGMLNEPSGLAWGPDGNIYAAYFDGYSNPNTGAILRFNPEGKFLGVYSTAARDPVDLKFGPDGNLYVSRFNASPLYGVVRVFGPHSPQAGQLDTTFPTLGTTSTRGVEILTNPDNTFDILWTNSTSVVRSRLDGSTRAIYGNLISFGQGLELAPSGKLYATSDVGNRVSVLDLPGGATNFTQLHGAGGGATPALSTPLGIAFDELGNVLVNNMGGNTVAKFDPATGAFLGNLVSAGSGGLSGPHHGLLRVTRPDPPMASLLVGNFADDTVTRFDALTGAFIDTFIPAGSGGLDGVTGIARGPDGDLYVASHLNHKIMRYDGRTGAPKPALGKPGAEFVSAGAGGLTYPERLLFLDDGSLLVASYSSANLLRFDSNGNSLGPLNISPLSQPVHMVVGPDRNADTYPDLYVTDNFTGSPVGRVDVLSLAPGSMGVSLGTLASGLNGPHHLLFIPDRTGDSVPDLLVTEFYDNDVILLNGLTGADLGVFGQMNNTYLYQPTGLAFGADGNLYVASRGIGGVGPHRVVKFSTDGQFLELLVYGNVDAPGTLLFEIPEPSATWLILLGVLTLAAGKRFWISDSRFRS